MESFPLEYVHLICLGVMKRLLLFPKESPRLRNLSNRHIGQISEKLGKLKELFPSEIACQPRGLNDLNRFKAAKLRMFLFYTGTVVMKRILPQACCKHFELI